MKLDDLRTELDHMAEDQPSVDLDLIQRGIERHVRRHRRRVVVVLMAMIALIVGVGAVLTSAAPHGEDLGVTTEVGGFPRLVPDSMQLMAISDVDRDPSLQFTVYATGQPDDPLGGESFAVSVRQGRVYPYTDSAYLYTSGMGVSNHMTPSATVSVFSRSFSSAQLQQIASSATFAPDGVSITSIDIPPGYQPVATSSQIDYVALRHDAYEGLPSGYTADWAKPSEGALSGPVSIRIEVHPGTASDLDAIRWMLDGSTSIDVAGHPGVEGAMPDSTGIFGLHEWDRDHPATNPSEPLRWIVAWQPDDHTIVIVTAPPTLSAVPTGCSGDCPRSRAEEVARSVHEIDEDAWQRFLFDATTTTLPLCDAGTSTSGSRRTPRRAKGRDAETIGPPFGYYG